MGITAEELSKEQLTEHLYKLFTFFGPEYFDDIFYDDVIDLEDDVDRERYEAELYADKLYPNILNYYETSTPFQQGHHGDGSEFFEHEFLYWPSLYLTECVDEAIFDGPMEYMECTELYLLSNGDIAEVNCISVKEGEFEYVHRSLNRMIESYEDLCFEDYGVIQRLDYICNNEYGEEENGNEE